MEHFNVVVLGAGTGGLSVAARLRKLGLTVAIADPSDTHYFQPHWTLAGAGIVTKESTARPTASLIPPGVTWYRRKVDGVWPRKNLVSLEHDGEIGYDFLIVATGLRIAWEKIGGDGRYVSIYDFNRLDKVLGELREFGGGTALFTMPPSPIKCAGAPQKIMYLAEQMFREKGVREKTKIIFAVAGQKMFSQPDFADALDKIARARGIECRFQHELVKTENGVAHFKSGTQIPYDFLHAVPPMENHAYLKNSGLCDAQGWLEVDRETLRSPRFKNVYGVGDVIGAPCSKTAAAARAQAKVVAENFADENLKYDGYSACPIVTEKGQVLFAEFGYDGKLLPTLPLKNKPNRLMWLYYRYLFPRFYWNF